MADSDDDAPPPLSSLADQVEALRLRNEGTASTSSGGPLPVASIVLIEPKLIPGPKPAVIKKGFFDAKPKPKPRPAAVPKPIPKAASGDGEEELVIDLTNIKRQAHQFGDGPAVPDFMMIPPDEQAAKYAVYKEQLVEALQPCPDTVDQVSKDPTLLAGFDDPEVMQAVADIAANPQNFKKYEKNAKVLRFYSAMGKMMGSKLEKMGAAAPAKPQ